MAEVQYSHDIDQIDDLHDSLGRGPMVEAIAKEILAHVDATHNQPRIIGVYGGWGSGKSFLLSQVIAQLRHHNQNNTGTRVIVGVYKAWQYEAVGDLAPGLVKTLGAIKDTFNTDLLGGTETYQKLAKHLLQALAVTSPLLGPVGVLGEMADKALQLWEERAQIEDVRAQMTELVNAIIAAAKEKDPTCQYRVVIFIDDLDRCSPENMVRMLEWLKVHLSVPNCTYVLALDHRAAAQAIIGRYREYISDQGKDVGLGYGLRYLEKLVDREYELGPATHVEPMAILQVFGPAYSEKRLSEVISSQVGQFPGRQYMDEMLRMRTLQLPRTMLKIFVKYKTVMEILNLRESSKLRQQLRQAYPLWALLLTSMYYRLDPSHLDDFIRGRGNIYELLKDHTSIDENEWGDRTSPFYEFCRFAHDVNRRAGTTIPFPTGEALRQLAEIVRQNAPLAT